MKTMLQGRGGGAEGAAGANKGWRHSPNHRTINPKALHRSKSRKSWNGNGYLRRLGTGRGGAIHFLSARARAMEQMFWEGRRRPFQRVRGFQEERIRTQEVSAPWEFRGRRSELELNVSVMLQPVNPNCSKNLFFKILWVNAVRTVCDHWKFGECKFKSDSKKRGTISTKCFWEGA